VDHEDHTTGQTLGSTVLLAAALYFAPTFVATSRGHYITGAIFALNLLLGWIVLGWIAALIWSLTYVDPGKRPMRPVIAPNPVAMPVLFLLGLAVVLAAAWKSIAERPAPATTRFETRAATAAAAVTLPIVTAPAIKSDPTKRSAVAAYKHAAKVQRHSPSTEPAVADSAEAARRAWVAEWQRKCAAMPRDEGIATCGQYYAPPRR
jgi:hypothetical protein